MHRILMNFTFMSSDSALHAAASSWQVTVELHYHVFNKARLCKNVKFYNDSLGHQRQLVLGLQDPPPVHPNEIKHTFYFRCIKNLWLSQL